MINVKCLKHSELSISVSYCWLSVFRMLLKVPHLCDQLDCLVSRMMANYLLSTEGFCSCLTGCTP